MAGGKRMAIIGCGSSGLITLKCARDVLPDWDIVAFERSGQITGCWGRPPGGFVSTSTRYTTQFACFRQFDARVQRDATSSDPRDQFADFFRDEEYGDYLEAFADRFDLRAHIRCHTEVIGVEPGADNDWVVNLKTDDARWEERFQAVVFCTGLADVPRSVDAEVPVASTAADLKGLRHKRVVVIGGGESAVDVARRLADPERGNEVWLSVRSGMRVSPRYHPIRGVPSDFLRNRLLLSFDAGLRNRLGHLFVTLRMRFRGAMEWMFPPEQRQRAKGEDIEHARAVRDWSLRLMFAARDSLFNMYHNKSDDFLDDVARGRIRIVGAQSDESARRYFAFGTSTVESIDPDYIVPAMGFRSRMEALSSGRFLVRDFYHGIVHARHPGIFAVGFARPIIGNIPTISEMQARYLSAVLKGAIDLGPDLPARHHKARIAIQKRFPQLDTDNVHPVEMFPYCDRLAREMGCYPGWSQARSLRGHLRCQLEPATTLHYDEGRSANSEAPIHMPWLLVGLLVALKPLDWTVRGWRAVLGKTE